MIKFTSHDPTNLIGLHDFVINYIMPTWLIHTVHVYVKQLPPHLTSKTKEDVCSMLHFFILIKSLIQLNNISRAPGFYEGP